MHFRGRIHIGVAGRWRGVSAKSATLAVVMGATVIAGTATAAATTSIGAFSCHPVQFYGARGSGENNPKTNFGGYGSTVHQFEQTLADLEPAMSPEPVDYPAVPVGYTLWDYNSTYDNSVAAGEYALQTDLIVLWHQCPNTYVILAGYSQGAQVVGDVADSLPAKQRAKIAAVALFGDPKFNPHQSKVDVATGYAPKEEGILVQLRHESARQVPGDLVPRVHSYCIPSDPICNYNLLELDACAQVSLHLLPSSDCPHLDYADFNLPLIAAHWADGVLKSLPAL